VFPIPKVIDFNLSKVEGKQHSDMSPLWGLAVFEDILAINISPLPGLFTIS
jgi:hypothetical protein